MTLKEVFDQYYWSPDIVRVLTQGILLSSKLSKLTGIGKEVNWLPENPSFIPDFVLHRENIELF